MGLACTLTIDSFNIPDICPVLGIPLFRKGAKGYSDNAPSLDRIIPERGYVPGNVIVISMRANRIKNNATIQELCRVHDFFRDIALRAACGSPRTAS